MNRSDTDKLVEYRLHELEMEIGEMKKIIKTLEEKENSYIRAALIALGGAVVSLGIYIWRLKIG